jgi:choline monooxygenase
MRLTTPRIVIDPDIRRAATLPAAVYRDRAWFELQTERVFAPAWHLVGSVHDLPEPGAAHPFTLLEGCLDEPLLLTRDAGGALHCLSNVCTHRGNLVCEAAGPARHLRCRYHGRRFGLDGRCEFMPEFEDVAGFPSPADDLPRLPLERWGPFLFASLAPACPFAEWIEPLATRFAWLPLHRLVFDAAASRHYEIDANWALYCDNYLEEFHIPYVHGHSLAGLDYAAYRTETWAWSSLQFGIARPGDPVLEPPPGHADHGQRLAAYYAWFFPGTMCNFYPWGLSINVVEPLGPARTRIRFLAWVWDEAARGRGAGGDLHRVEMEDEAVVLAVQRGVRSRLYDRGRYSPRREVGTHHFHRLLARALNGDSP